jgi:hypothetical protein
VSTPILHSIQLEVFSIEENLKTGFPRDLHVPVRLSPTLPKQEALEFQGITTWAAVTREANLTMGNGPEGGRSKTCMELFSHPCRLTALN